MIYLLAYLGLSTLATLLACALGAAAKRGDAAFFTADAERITLSR